MWIFSGTTQWIYLLLKGRGGGGVGWRGFRFEIQRRSQVVFKVIKRSDIQILLKDLKGKMRGERLEIYWSLLLNKSKRIVTIVQTVQR